MNEPAIKEPVGHGLAPVHSLGKALARAQGMMDAAKKDKDNPFFRSKYSDLASCWAACRVPLSSNGLAVVQNPFNGEGNKVGIETRLIHESGETLTSRIETTPKDSTPQSLGSAITYLRRYALCSMVGISPEEDDGNAASGKTTSGSPRHHMPETKRARPTPPPAPLQVKELEIYSHDNPEHKSRLFGFLDKSGKVAKDLYEFVSGAMDGKPISAQKIQELVDDAVRLKQPVSD